jgi:hypothetical protein
MPLDNDGVMTVKIIRRTSNPSIIYQWSDIHLSFFDPGLLQATLPFVCAPGSVDTFGERKVPGRASRGTNLVSIFSSSGMNQ